MRETDSKP